MIHDHLLLIESADGPVSVILGFLTVSVVVEFWFRVATGYDRRKFNASIAMMIAGRSTLRNRRSQMFGRRKDDEKR